MWDVSAFMKLLKQRFTQWFNRQRGRKGTLWEERFKKGSEKGSVLDIVNSSPSTFAGAGDGSDN
jgi:hypothetical protein